MDRQRRVQQQSRYRYDSVDDQPSPGDANRSSTVDSGRGTLESRDRTAQTPSSVVSTSTTPANRLDQPDDDDDPHDHAHTDDPQELQIEPMVLYAGRLYERALVSHLDHPSAFFVQLHLPDGKFEAMQAEINKFYSKESRTRPEWKRGQYCIAKYPPDNLFYRARIVEPVRTHLGSRERPTTYTVVYIDYGSRENVALADLHSLEREFTYLPAQAIPCSLDKTLPRSGSWLDHPHGMELFRKLVNQQFVDITVQPKSRRDAWPLNFVEILHSETKTDIRDRLREANEIRLVPNEEIYFVFNPLLTRADLIIYNIEHEGDPN